MYRNSTYQMRRALTGRRLRMGKTHPQTRRTLLFTMPAAVLLGSYFKRQDRRRSKRVDWSICAFGLTLYKTFRRHGLQLLAGLVQPGVADAMEGTVDRGRTHAICIEAQGWGEHVLAMPRVRHLPSDRLQSL